jgi:hypothetical protein
MNTPKVKAVELEGAALDFWVSEAEDAGCCLENFMVNPPRPGACWRMVDGRPDFSKPYSPSTDWALGGPIIERENICVLAPKYINMVDDRWTAGVGAVESYDGWYGSTKNQAEGPTLLVAAMRAYVMSKFGEQF